MDQVRVDRARRTVVSLDADEARALRLLASEERFANTSAAVGRLIRDEMRRRHGQDWLMQLPMDTDDDAR